MIQKETLLQVVDNSGVRFAKCLQVKKTSNLGRGLIGDIVVVSVKTVQKKLKLSNKIKKGDILYGVIVRTKNRFLKIDSEWCVFFQNSIVLINKSGKPLGSRIFGSLPKMLRQKKCFKIISLSSGIV
jgi:large subunit ribosomal protein L14